MSASRWTLLVASVAAVTACGTRTPVGGPAPAAEGAASTDIYVYRLRGLPIVSRGQLANLTQRRGYDNQPFWDGNERLLYTSQHGGQTDIYAIDFESSTIQRVTNTPESEYSAAPTPDDSAVTVIRVERDSTQRLWRFPRNGSEPSVILPDLKPVGYFAWLDTTRLALFVLGSPNALHIGDARTGKTRVVANGIGRSLQRVPGSRKASFLHRVGSKWVLKTVDADPASLDIRMDSLAVMPDSADYVVWRSADELYTAAGSRILRLRPPSREWELVADLSNDGVMGISRLALSPDGRKLALVAQDR
jgi:hypothetical protein